MEEFDPRIFLSPESRDVLERLEASHHEGQRKDSPYSKYFSEEACEQLKPLSKGNSSGKPNTYINEVKDAFVIDFAWNSCRLEGNSYTVLEVEHLFNVGEPGVDKKQIETQMLLNQRKAICYLIDLEEHLVLNQEIVEKLRALLDEKREVKQVSTILEKAQGIENPFEQAFFLLIHFSYSSPLLSRIMVNIPLFTHNMCPLSFIEVPRELYLKGVRSICQLGAPDLLRDMFIWGYARSSLFYSRNPATIGPPDPFRLRYRILISEAVSTIVKQGLNKKEAVAAIKLRSNHFLPAEDREQFINTIEMILRNLHGGNFLRFEIIPPEFEAWQKTWRGSD